VQKNAPKLETAARNLSKPALSEGTNLAGAVFGTILSLFTIGFLSLFMLLEAPRLKKGLLGSMRPDRRRTVEDVAHRVAHQVTAYVLGTIALSVLFGVVILVTLLILGVPFALLIGLWVALVAMIPLVGGLIAAVPSVLIALLHSPTAGLVTLIVFVGFQLVENHFIYPVVMSRSVRMNPLWVLLSVLIGANLGGVFRWWPSRWGDPSRSSSGRCGTRPRRPAMGNRLRPPTWTGGRRRWAGAESELVGAGRAGRPVGPTVGLVGCRHERAGGAPHLQRDREHRTGLAAGQDGGA
jgi:hypothetical protein